MTAPSRHFVGIDLGTTYSSISLLDEHDKPQTLPNGHKKTITPSIVYFPEDGGQPLVGEDAVKPGCRNPDRFVEHAKRHLGTDKTWEIDGVLYTPVDISAILVAHLLADVPKHLPVTEAVITVPAHFTGYQRQLTIQAGKQAGLQKVSIVNEPVAAALSFVLGEKALGFEAQAASFLESEKDTILVFDLGGGTLDLSVVRYDGNQLRVIAANGDGLLGGIDWDDELLNLVSDKISTICGDIRKDKNSLRRARFKLEAAKCRLSQDETTILRLQLRRQDLEFRITRTEFEQQTAHLVDRCRKLTEDLLAGCRLTLGDLECLLPVGSATLMPMIDQMLQAFAAQRNGGKNWAGNFIRRISPDKSIANGAALFAGMIASDAPLLGTGAATRTLANYRTQNVSTNDLGVVVCGSDGRHQVHTLIERQTPLPATANVTVATVKPNQSRVSIKIVEGHRSTSNGKVLCKCTLDHLPRQLPASSEFDVNLTYDADGLLHVIAKHRETGRLATVSALYGNE